MTSVSRDAKNDIDAAETAAKRTIDTVADRASRAVDAADDAVSGVGDKLRDVAQNASAIAADKADKAREALTETGERLKDTLRRATDRSELRAMQDQIAAAVSSGVAVAADAVRDGRVGEVAADLRDAARRNPAPFILGAAVAGFVLGRFMISHHDRSRDRGGRR